MALVAVVEKYQSNTDYKKYFDFDYELFHMCDENVKRVLKKDIREEFYEEFDKEEWDYVILVGADTCKHVAKINSVTKYQGYLVEDKWLPISNPAMLAFKPEGTNAFNKAVENIKNYINGGVTSTEIKTIMIEDSEELRALLNHILENVDILAVDCETSALYPRDGYVLGVGIAFSENKGYYIIADCIDDEMSYLFQKVFNKCKVVFHNKKFDASFLGYHFNWVFKDTEDTMLMHYTLDERVGTHDLKSLAIKYTNLGDYDKELQEYKINYCKSNGIKQEDFTYDLIPHGILAPYGAKDPVATYILYNMFAEKVYSSEHLKNAYTKLLLAGTDFLIQIENNGVPFSKKRLLSAQEELSSKIKKLLEEFYEYREIHELESQTGKQFNPNSVQQLRILFFDILHLPKPSKRTGTGQLSVDAEVLKELSNLHPLPNKILTYKQSLKIKSTYIDKVLLNLDTDSRLRTGFNLTTTTSGRLSSSGKMNMQQLPRDNKIVKYCIKANEGNVIVSMDLTTAEMYVVAVLSGDKNLQSVFISGGDFHSSVAHMVFKLTCDVSEVKSLYPDLRQAAKAISFGIKKRGALCK